jgi:hypothetical protein
VLLPDKIIYGVTYNTSDEGFHPYGDAATCHDPTDKCGYDSLNVAESLAPVSPSVGSDPEPGTAHVDSTAPGSYCDGGGGGTGTFRFDSPGFACWGSSMPAVQFDADDSPSASIDSANTATVVAGQRFSFTVTTTGVPTPSLHKGAGHMPHGLTFHDNGDGTATIQGVAPARDRDGAYAFTVRASNGRGSLAKQRVTFTVTGARS